MTPLFKRSVLATTLTLFFTAASPADAADTGSCTTVAKVGSAVWKYAGPSTKKALSASGPFGATAANAIELVEKGVKLWNHIAGDQSWAKIGPRRMDFDAWNKGTLIGPTERLFVSAIPAVNPVTLELHKLGNDGKVKVVICKIPEKGKAEAVKTFTVDKDTPKGKVKSVEIADAKGYVISVVLHGKSVAKSLKYKLRAKLKYDDKKAEQAQAKTTTAPRTSGGTKKTAPRK